MPIKEFTASEIQSIADRTGGSFAQAEKSWQMVRNVFVSQEEYWLTAREIVEDVGDDPNERAATEYIASMQGMSPSQIEEMFSAGQHTTFQSYLESVTGCSFSPEMFE